MHGRGCVVRVQGGKSSIYKIDGWPSGLSGGSLITIDSIITHESDIARPIIAVDNYRALYRFGKNFGEVVVHGSIYLGSVDKNSSGSAIGAVSGAFESMRLSNKKTPTNVSIASGYRAKVYFNALEFGESQPEINKITYSMRGIIAPVGGGTK